MGIAQCKTVLIFWLTMAESYKLVAVVKPKRALWVLHERVNCVLSASVLFMLTRSIFCTNFVRWWKSERVGHYKQAS